MKIVPGKSVGPLVIGMRRDEYEAVVGVSARVLKRTPDDPGYFISYREKSLQLIIGADGTLTSISVFRLETVELEGIQLLGRDLSSVEADLNQLGFAVEKAEVGLWIPKAGVLLVEINDRVDCVEVMAAEDLYPAIPAPCPPKKTPRRPRIKNVSQKQSPPL